MSMNKKCLKCAKVPKIEPTKNSYNFLNKNKAISDQPKNKLSLWALRSWFLLIADGYSVNK